jgi:hypothetical protein
MTELSPSGPRAAYPFRHLHVSFRPERTWSARKHRCSEEPSGRTSAPASANGPACDFERHSCRSPVKASPRPSYERPAWDLKVGLTTVLRASSNAVQTAIGSAIRVEEADHPLRPLERLNQPIQQNAVETTILPTDAVFVVLKK